MKGIAGIVLLAIGLIPLLLFLLGSVVWATHMYTIGIDPNLRITVILIAAADAICIGIGAYLVLDRRKLSN